MNRLLIPIYCLAMALMLPSCNAPVTEPSFYYWRTKAVLSAKETQTLKNHHINTLYVRFFDVDLSEDSKKPLPFGVIDSLASLPESLTVIPVVYITNRTLIGLKEAEVTTLAKQIVSKVNGLRKQYSELQIDCDWSEKTKTRYFKLLQDIKKELLPPAKLTATIRLHQVKYPLKTGVPPVDGGMLMFYNMGDLHKQQGPNSIFDEGTANAYSAYIKSYALHLDAALPVFRWYVHYRNGSIQGLITKKQLPDVSDTALFAKTGNIHYTVKQAQLLRGVYYKTGDELKYEALTDEELIAAAKLLQTKLLPESRRLVLYDLDELNIEYYEKETFKNVFAIFN